MMSQIDVCLEELVTAILDSQEYQNYQKVKREVSMEPEKKNALNDYRRRNYLLQKNIGDVDLFEKTEQLQQEFAQLREQPLVDEYLSAESALCRLIQKINWRIMENVDFDLVFWD